MMSKRMAFLGHSNQLSFAMDLTPLIKDSNLDIKQYILGYIQRFSEDVSEKLEKFI